MWALGAMRYERAVQGLNELFQYHQRGPLASAAFDALARIGHPSSLPQFVAQLNGKNATFKLIAIEGLARTGDRSRAESIDHGGQQRTERCDPAGRPLRERDAGRRQGRRDRRGARVAASSTIRRCQYLQRNRRRAARRSSRVICRIRTSASASTSSTRSACRAIRRRCRCSSR